MKKVKLTRSLLAAVSVVALTAVMYGCVHSDDDSTPAMDMTDSEPTAYQTAKDAIMAAETAEAAQEAYDAVDKEAITGAEAASLMAALESRKTALATMAREAAQKMALMTAAGMIDTSDLSTAEAIAAATTAINALQAAIDAAADVDDTSMYESQVATARMAVATAQNNLDTQGRMAAQRMAISSAVTMARTAVNGVDDESTDSEVASADSAIAALQMAIDNADDLPADDPDVASAQGTLTTLMAQLRTAKASRKVVLDAAEEKMREDMAAVGKALHAALGPPTSTVTPQNALGNATASLDAAGLTITAADGAGAIPDGTTPPVAILMAGDSAGSLDGWMGMDYALSTGTGDAKVTNEARVYTNQGPGTRKAFAETLPGGVTIATANAGGTTPAQVSEATTAIAGYMPVASTGTITTGLDIGKVMAAAFTHSGRQTHAIPDQRNSFSVRGTYDGAPGEYRCVVSCSSTNDNTGSPSALGGTWFFKPDAGAMALQPDDHYLYYGWWVSKDGDGGPTAASAFAGRVGTDATNSTDGLDPAWSGTYSTTAGSETITGSASYAGSAAGKYAIDNVLDGTGHGGHFTADVILEAKFSGTEPGVTGTIDEFRLNDGSDDPGWIVTLARGGFGDGGAITAPADDAATTAVDEGLGTVWSIDGNEAPASGTWSGTMYDEAVTGDDDDGSNIPTTVTGTFYSEFSTIGRMVGAFGAGVDDQE